MVREVSGGFVVRDKKLLMIEDDGRWTVPSEISDSGEISSDTAKRAVENILNRECTVRKYKSRLKTTYSKKGQEFSWKPYAVEVETEEVFEVEDAEWVPIKQLDEVSLVEPLEKTLEKVQNRF